MYIQMIHLKQREVRSTEKNPLFTTAEMPKRNSLQE